jgi:hypothetical protein
MRLGASWDAFWIPAWRNLGMVAVVAIIIAKLWSRFSIPVGQCRCREIATICSRDPCPLSAIE